MGESEIIQTASHCFICNKQKVFSATLKRLGIQGYYIINVGSFWYILDGVLINYLLSISDSPFVNLDLMAFSIGVIKGIYDGVEIETIGVAAVFFIDSTSANVISLQLFFKVPLS